VTQVYKTPALRRLRQENLYFKARLGYIVRPCRKNQKQAEPNHFGGRDQKDLRSRSVVEHLPSKPKAEFNTPLLKKNPEWLYGI
jgi:hypothetical protein